MVSAVNDRGGQSLLASVSVALTGAVWGIYWIPLRHLAAHGFTGAWANAAFFLTSLPPALVLAFIVRREVRANGARLLAVAAGNGCAFTLYSIAYTQTTVFNVLFLFYLSPVWTVLMTRFILKERVGRARLAAVAVGLVGLAIMLGNGGGWPIPRNSGDWMALFAGVFWSVVAICIRRNPQVSAVANTVAFFFGGILPALGFAFLLDGSRMPSFDAVHAAWPVLLAIAWVLWLPSQFTLFWGVSRISPVRTGILLMTELVSGVATAAWLSGDPISAQQALGGALIVAAGVGDVLANRESAAPPVPAAVTPD
jgi:drug/metabolite transporter (DMT)-like permease